VSAHRCRPCGQLGEATEREVGLLLAVHAHVVQAAAVVLLARRHLLRLRVRVRVRVRDRVRVRVRVRVGIRVWGYGLGLESALGLRLRGRAALRKC